MWNWQTADNIGGDDDDDDDDDDDSAASDAERYLRHSILFTIFHFIIVYLIQILAAASN